MKNWKLWASILLSVVCLYAAFSNIDWYTLFKIFRDADYLKIFYAMVIIAAMLFVRGHRWSLFLKPIKKIPVIPLFWSTAIGFGVNNVMPFRLGEPARAFSIHKKQNISFGESLGSIVVERLYDTFSILFMFAGCLLFLDFEAFSELIGGQQNQAGVAIMIGGGGVGLLFFVLLLKFRSKLALSIAGFFLKVLPEKWQKKILTFLENFIGGLTQTKNPLEMLWIVILSFGLWVISAYTVYLIVDATGITVNFTQTMTLLMAMVVAVAIPAAPGYVGTYHYLCSMALVLVTGIPKMEALAIATLIHATNYIPQTFLGIGALTFEGIRLSDVQKAKQIVDQQEADKQGQPILPG